MVGLRKKREEQPIALFETVDGWLCVKRCGRSPTNKSLELGDYVVAGFLENQAVQGNNYPEIKFEGEYLGGDVYLIANYNTPTFIPMNDVCNPMGPV